MDENHGTLIPDVTDHRSYSQFSLWERCSLAYYYRYVLNWSERPSLALANGKAGHGAVEYNLLHKLNTEDDAPLENILDVFATQYDQQTHELEPTDLRPGEDIGQTKDLTINTLTHYRIKEAPLVKPIAVESEFRLDIPPTEEHDFPMPPVIGRIDLIGKRPTLTDEERRRMSLETIWDRNPALTEVIDHKFVKRLKSQKDVDFSDQLTLYDMVMAKAGLPTDRLGLELFVPPNTREGPRIIQVFRSPELMTDEVRQERHKRLTYKMRTIERAIQSGIFVPKDDPMVCSFCGFFEQCQGTTVDKWTALKVRQAQEKAP